MILMREKCTSSRSRDCHGLFFMNKQRMCVWARYESYIRGYVRDRGTSIEGLELFSPALQPNLSGLESDIFHLFMQIIIYALVLKTCPKCLRPHSGLKFAHFM